MVNRRLRTALLAGALALAACAAPHARRGLPQWNRVQSAAAPQAAAGLRHYPAGGAHVLVVGPPGLAASLYDVPGFGGLAPYLQNRGYDVWVVDWADAPLTLGLAELGALAHGMAGAVNADGRGLFVVAHGLGGVAWLAAPGAPAVLKYVFLAVPATLRMPLAPVAAFGREVPAGTHSLTEAAAAYAGVRSERKLLDELLWSYGAAPLDPAGYARFYRPVGAPLLTELGAAVRAEGWGPQVRASLAAVTVPVRVYVGQADSLAPVWQVFETYRWAGAADKRFRFLGRANTDGREYGHLSLVAGRDAAREVFPFVRDALEK